MGAVSEKWFNPDIYLLEDYDKTPLPTRTHLNSLDEMLGGGFSPGLWFVTAAPGTGKSAFGLYLALLIAWGGTPCAFVSLEMTPAQCWHRLASAWSASPAARNYGVERFRWSDVPAMAGRARDAVAAGTMIYELRDRDPFVAATMTMMGHGVQDGWRFPLYNTDNDGDRGLDAVSATLAEARDMGCGMAVVDYFQLIEASRGEGTYERATEVVHGLRDAATAIGIPVVVIASMNRDSLKRGKGETSMHDASGTAAIEYDATGIIALRTIDDDSTPDTRRIEARVHKNRVGRSGTALLFDYVPAYNTFTDIRRTE